jgi:hypothetical protein
VETHGLSGPVPAITGDKWGHVVVGNIITDGVEGSITCFSLIMPQFTFLQATISVVVLCVIVHKCISTTIKCWREFRQFPYGICSAEQDGGLATAAAVDGGAYGGRLIVTTSGKKVYYGGGKRIDSISPSVGAYVWQRTA